MSLEIAKQLIAEAKEKQLTTLDLGKCGLTDPDNEIPELFELTQLEELSLEDYGYDLNSGGFFESKNKGKQNRLSVMPQGIKQLKKLKVLVCGNLFSKASSGIEDISVLSGLTNLQKLSLSNTQVQDISVLSGLTNLETLWLDNTQVQDISVLSGLTNLETLWLDNTQVQDISVLSGLTNLQTLSLSDTQVQDISVLSGLTHLQWLSLSDTQVQDISVLSGLTNLQTLWLSNTQVQDILALSGMTNLQTLSLSNTQVQDISVLSGLTNLQWLSLSDTQVQDISVLSGLTNLQWLSLFNTQVQDISVLSGLTKLQTLWLANNQIKQLPDDFKKLKKLTEFNFSGNPFMKYIPNLERYTPQEQINYILDIQANSLPVREAKVVFVGQGDIGKTTLLGWLLEGEKPKTEQTDKIEVRDNSNLFTYQTAEGKEEPLTVHFWDFGGQQIMHATHKFFMTERTVYVLVVNNRNDDQEKTEQWIDLLKSTCGDSPVIVAANHCDKPDYKHSLSERDLKYSFDNIQLPIVETSGETGRGIPELKAAIQAAIQQLDFLEFPVPAPFFTAKTALLQLDKPYIEYDEFLKVCESVAEAEKYDFGEGKQEIFADLLNDLGVLLNFRKKQDDNLEDLMVFSPQWIINGVFALIVNGENYKGIMLDEKAQEILKGKGFKKARERDYIIKMMQSFELAYENSICGYTT